ncbi:prepilin peptidase [Actinoplanes siamensis]|uniref:Prepilin type IV endopeptidase peptidase domain-containing protein n=1 Tax=Actinoplanes siamensis TaxID=1223317 RepID=A0A919N574_9ACTN|nr:prepilin peptidase [Actinoplanes siamensis]GIF04639.1 hypothetical protein Asi03nite_21770 [Actinoplanes siamensis]
MEVSTVLAAGLAAGAAGVPAAALAYAASPEGPIRLSRRWWRGEPATFSAVALVAALTAATAGFVCAAVPLSPVLPAYWLFAVVAVVLLIIDLRQRRLPHVLTSVLWFAFITGFAAESLAGGEPRRFVEAVIAGAVVTMLALVTAIGFPGQLGLGDVNLAGAVAMSLGWFGPSTAVRGLVTAVIIQALVGIVSIWSTGNRQIAVPFGPALLIGWLLAIGLNI